jgi:plasmid stability protein
MANLQVKNIPDTLHQRLRHYAQKHRCTLSDIVLIALERELARREWHERLVCAPL